MCRWRAAGAPAATRARPVQRYAGTDRQARGRVLALLRDHAEAVPRAEVDAVWPDAEQRERAVRGLLADGLVVALPDGRLGLPA
jgi:A/G-specific adenine glycosylase